MRIRSDRLHEALSALGAGFHVRCLKQMTAGKGSVAVVLVSWQLNDDEIPTRMINQINSSLVSYLRHNEQRMYMLQFMVFREHTLDHDI